MIYLAEKGEFEATRTKREKNETKSPVDFKKLIGPGLKKSLKN